MPRIQSGPRFTPPSAGYGHLPEQRTGVTRAGRLESAVLRAARARDLRAHRVGPACPTAGGDAARGRLAVPAVCGLRDRPPEGRGAGRPRAGGAAWATAPRPAADATAGHRARRPRPRPAVDRVPGVPVRRSAGADAGGVRDGSAAAETVRRP